jgi:hypothetical protein
MRIRIARGASCFAPAEQMWLVSRIDLSRALSNQTTVILLQHAHFILPQHIHPRTRRGVGGRCGLPCVLRLCGPNSVVGAAGARAPRRGAPGGGGPRAPPPRGRGERAPPARVSSLSAEA